MYPRSPLVVGSRIVLALSIVSVSSCASVIQNIPAVKADQPQPTDNPVQPHLDWSGIQDHNGTPTVYIDSADVTSSFAINGSCCTADGKFILSPGQHQIAVDVPNSGIYSPYYQEYLPFIVTTPSFTFSVSPSAVTLNPGNSASVTVTAAPVHDYNGGIGAPTVSNLPAGVTATSTATGNNKFQVALVATPNAAATSVTSSINAQATGICSNCAVPASGTAANLGVTVTAPFKINSIPTSVLVPRGGSSTITITVVRASFNGPITVTQTGATNGVTAPAADILASSNSGAFTFAATTAAGLTDIATGNVPASQPITLTLTGQCSAPCIGGVVQASTTLSIGRRLGLLAVAPPTYANAPSGGNSVDNAVSVAYAVASSSPPGQSLFTATYKRAGANSTLAQVNLEQSVSSWGAGFCSATPTVAGIVLSNTYGNSSNAQLTYTLPIWAPAPATSIAKLHQFPLYTEQNDVHVSFAPTLWYSPDCTIAAFVHSTGVSATPLGLSVIDMRTGGSISDLSFSGSFPSKLEVVGTALPQTLNVTFSASDIRHVSLP
jgi:hypothetical protein